VRVDDGGGPLPGALGAGAVTVCRVLTLRLAVIGKSCDFSDEILRTRAMDSGQFELGAYRLDAQSRMLFREGCPPGPTPRWPRSWSPPCRPRMLIERRTACHQLANTAFSIGKRTAKRRRPLRVVNQRHEQRRVRVSWVSGMFRQQGFSSLAFSSPRSSKTVRVRSSGQCRTC
jgi:hypothetical protein